MPNPSSNRDETTVEVRPRADRGEIPAFRVPGIWSLLWLLVVLGLAAWQGYISFAPATSIRVFDLVAGALTFAAVLFALRGMIVVSPGQAVVLTSLGRYIGTLGDEGWYWISPFARRRRISLRTVVSTSDIVRTHNAAAQPLELAATVMWQIDDTFRAAFCVEDPAGLVEKQALSALIRVAENLFPSPADEAHDTTTMRGNLEEVRANELRREIQSLSEFAGLRILDARLSHFRYLTAPALPRITPTYVPMLHAIASTTHATIREVVCEVHQGTLAGPVGDDDDSPPN